MEARGDGVGRRKEDWEERGSDEEGRRPLEGGWKREGGRRPLEGGLEEGGRKEASGGGVGRGREEGDLWRGGWKREGGRNKGKEDIQGSDCIRTEAI